jgi:hypothetical protein
LLNLDLIAPSKVISLYKPWIGSKSLNPEGDETAVNPRLSLGYSTFWSSDAKDLNFIDLFSLKTGALKP